MNGRRALPGERLLTTTEVMDLALAQEPDPARLEEIRALQDRLHRMERFVEVLLHRTDALQALHPQETARADLR